MKSTSDSLKFRAYPKEEVHRRGVEAGGIGYGAELIIAAVEVIGHFAVQCHTRRDRNVDAARGTEGQRVVEGGGRRTWKPASVVQ